MSRRLEHRHGRYIIHARMIDCRAVAVASLYGAPAGWSEIASAGAETQEEAAFALRRILDERRRARLAARQRRAVGGDGEQMAVPLAEEYLEALAVLPRTEPISAMLEVHAASGDTGMTAHALADAAGWKDHGSAHLHYGTFGKRMGEELGIELPSDSGEATTPIFALAGFGGRTAGGGWIWRMHPLLAEAVGRRPVS